MRRLTTVLIAVAVAAPVLILSLYALIFAPSAHGLSIDSEEWARFGEYVGGSLGAFYGFLAFVGVLITIRIQHSQSQLEELQRLMASVAQRIDAIFDSQPRDLEPHVRERLQQSGKTIATFAILAAAGTAALVDSAADDVEKKTQLISGAKKQLMNEGPLLSIELQHLVSLLRQYSKNDGSEAVAAFYVGRYAIPVAWMKITGILSSDIVEQFFQPSRVTDDMCRRNNPPASSSEGSGSGP